MIVVSSSLIISNLLYMLSSYTALVHKISSNDNTYKYIIMKYTISQ